MRQIIIKNKKRNIIIFQENLYMKKGFTVVELMVSLAIVVILFSSLFILNFRISSTWVTERARAELEQNFRFAIDTITTDLRRASTNPEIAALCSTNPPDPNYDAYRDSLVMIPEDNHFTINLKFKVYDEADNAIYQYRYYLETDAAKGTSVIMRQQFRQASFCESTNLVEIISQPITEEIKSLAAIYFAIRGNKLITIVVGRFEVMGQTKTISYAQETLIRNMAPQP